MQGALPTSPYGRLYDDSRVRALPTLMPGDGLATLDLQSSLWVSTKNFGLRGDKPISRVQRTPERGLHFDDTEDARVLLDPMFSSRAPLGDIGFSADG